MNIFLVAFLYLILNSSHAQADEKIPRWCAEDKYFSIEELYDSANRDDSFESAMDDYEAGNELLSILKFRNNAVNSNSPDAAYNTAFIAEEIKGEEFYGGEYYYDLCQNLKSKSDFNLAHAEYSKDTDEGDKTAIEIFSQLSHEGNPIASHFLARMYVYNPMGRGADYYDQKKSLEYALLSFSQGGSYSGRLVERFSGFAVKNFCDIGSSSSSIMSYNDIYSDRRRLSEISDACDSIIGLVTNYVEQYKKECGKEEDLCQLEKAISSGSGGLNEFCSYSVHWYEVAAKNGQKSALDRIIHIYGSRENKGLLDPRKTCLSYNNEKLKELSKIGVDLFPDDSHYMWNYGFANLERNLTGGFDNEILGTRYLRQAVLIDIQNNNLDAAIKQFNQIKEMELDNMFVEMIEKDIQDAL